MATSAIEIKGEEIGKPVSNKLSNYLKEYTTEQDRAIASVNSGISVHTIKSLAIGRINITEFNVNGLVELVNVAIAKCDKQSNQAKIAGNSLKKLLQSA